MKDVALDGVVSIGSCRVDADVSILKLLHLIHDEDTVGTGLQPLEDSGRHIREGSPLRFKTVDQLSFFSDGEAPSGAADAFTGNFTLDFVFPANSPRQKVVNLLIGERWALVFSQEEQTGLRRSALENLLVTEVDGPAHVVTIRQ